MISDPKCPYCIFIWNDYSTNIDSHRCVLQPKLVNSNDIKDYKECRSEKYNLCDVFIKNKSIIKNKVI